MKLVVLLDEKTKIDLTGCVVLTNVRMKEPHQNCKVFYSAPNYCDEMPEVRESILELFSHLHPERRIMENDFYMKLIRTPIAIVKQVDDIISQYNVDEMILIGGSEKPYCSMMFSEGEANKWWYKSSWLVNPILYKRFHGYLKIKWIDKHSVFRTRIRLVIREGILGIRGIAAAMKRSGNHYDTACRESKNNTVVVVAPMVLQMGHLTKLFHNADLHGIDFCFLTRNTSEWSERDDVVFIEDIGFLKILEIVRHILQGYGKKSVEFNCLGVRIKFKESEIRKILFSDEIVVRTLIGSIFQTIQGKIGNAKYIVTDMTFGSELKYIHQCCQDRGYKHLNFQYVTMSKMLFPDFNLADEYYLFSRKTYNLYKDFSESYKYYFPIERSAESKSEKIKYSIAIFTQPDSYADRYIDFLNNLCKLLIDNKMKLQVIIKPHYRQNKLDIIIGLSEKYDFVNVVDKNLNVEEVMKNSDFMMSMTSSVLFEAVSIGTPGIVLDIDGKDTEYIDKNDFAVLEVNYRVKSYEEIGDLLSDMPRYKKKYYERRETFLKENKAFFDLNSLFQPD